MRDVTLVRIPGTGMSTVSVNDNWTVQDLVDREDLQGRDIVINGRGIPRETWANTRLSGASEIFATASVKGNSDNFKI
jgi:sulfur carrier protein ThiS